MKVVTGVTKADIDSAKEAAKKATDEANAMEVKDGVTQDQINAAKAKALKATNDAAAMKVVTGVTQADIDSAKDAAKKATDEANAMKVGDDDDMTVAAKALLGGDVVQNIRAAADDAAAKDLYVNQAPTFLKDYGFINALLKNIPNQGKDVLKEGGDGNKQFVAPADVITEDNIKVLNSYAKIITTVCGIGPFITTDLPEKQSSNAVKDCLTQANKIAHAVVFDGSCGKDALEKGAVKAECYVELANKMEDLYNTDNFDAMSIDVSGEYPYNAVVPGYDSIA